VTRRLVLAAVPLAGGVAAAADRVRQHPAEKVAPAAWVIDGPLGFPGPANPMKPEGVKKLAAYGGWANFEDEAGRQSGFAVQEAEAE